MRTWIFASLAVLCMTATASAANVDLSIAMTDTPDPVTAGGNVSYSITVTNLTATPAHTVKVTDPLPTGSQLVFAGGTNWTCTAVSPITCTRTAGNDPIPQGAAQPITIIVQSPSSADGLPFTMTNVATVSVAGGDTDTVSTNNSATSTTSVKTSADLSITQTAAATVAAAGTITWDISVTNLGPSPSAMVTVTDTLPATVTNITAAGAAATGSIWTCTVAAQVATCNADPLALGSANEHITVTATAPNEPQTVTNKVDVAATTADPQSNNNSKSIDTNIVAGADLSIALTQDMPSILVSGTVMFNIVVTNHGPSTAQAVTVTNTLPTDDVFVSASGTGWTCTNATNVVTCDSSSLPVGDAMAITIVATGPGTPQKVIDMASVASTTVDPMTANNTASIETSILGSADIGITAGATDKALTGSEVAFTIDVRNIGPSDAQSVRVIDTLPDDVTFVKFEGIHWGCKNVDQTVTCDTTSISNGTSAPTITITVTAPAEGDEVTNLVTVSSSTHDPSADNNTAMATTTLEGIGIRGGSGCNAGGGGGGILVLVGVAFALRRRRAAMIGAAVLAGSSAASAQVAGGSESFPIDQMRLALDNDGILAVEFASVPKPGDWAAATFVGYQTNPLIAYNTATGQTIGALVKKRITGQLAIGVGITRWFEAGLELPIIYNQTRDEMAIPGVTSTLKTPRAGDLRLDPKFLLLRGGDGKVGIAAVAGIGIPTGGDSGYAGDGGLTFTPEIDVGFRKKGFRVALDGGLVVRSTKEVAGLKVDDQIFVRLGAAYRLPVGLELAAQLLTATSISHVWSEKNTDPTEADLGVTFATEGFSVFAMGGRGLQTGVGAPDWRFMAGIRLSPAADNKPADRDGDGIPDDKDKCPNEPETINGFQDEDGCPDRGDSAVSLGPDRIDTLEPVKFTGKGLNVAASLNVLRQIGATLRAHPELVRVRLTVHVQPTKNEQKDQELSDVRAKAVKDWLVGYGIDEKRLDPRGFGGIKPLVPANSKGAAAINDRLELVIMERK